MAYNELENADQYFNPEDQYKEPGGGINGKLPGQSPAISKPAGGYDYAKLRDNWGGGTPDELAAYVANNPDFASGVTVSGDKLILPNGAGTIDAIIGAKGGGTGRGWTPTGGGAQNPVYASPAAPVGSAPTTSPAAPGATNGTGVDPAMRDALLSLIKRSEAPVGDMSQDPRAQAYAGARQRASQQERAALAERTANSGLNSGGAGSGSFETGLQGIYESAGQDIAGQQAGLVGEEVQARRQDLLNALNLANAVGARDKAAEIQLKLADMDNQYKYAALGQNDRQFNAGLDQRRSEHNDEYGLRRSELEATLNRDAVLNALLGL